MANILVFGFPAHGHVYPTLPVIAELGERGHRVVYFTSERFCDDVSLAGAEARLYENAFLASRSGFDGPAFAAEAPALLFEATLSVLDNECPRTANEGFDAVVFDSVAPWGPLVAKQLDVPSIASISTFAMHRKMATMARGFERPTLARLRKKFGALRRASRLRSELLERHGARGPSWFALYCNRGDVNLVYTSREFQPFGTLLDASHRFVGPSLGTRGAAVDFPFDRLDDGKQTVFVSLGTSFLDDVAFYRHAMEAYSGRDDMQVVLSIGDLDPADLGPIPESVIVRPFVPQVELLARVDLFVTRCGMNSVSESLWHGVPILGVPHMAEQAVVARRAEQLGAGRFLRRRDVTTARLASVGAEVLGNPSYRKAASEIGQTLRGAGGFRRAADEIEAAIEATTRPV